jgi:hypothetical protein
VGRDGSAVEIPESATAPVGYERLDGDVPVLHPPRLSERAREVQGRLTQGYGALAEILAVEPPELRAMLIAAEDWNRAPRENEHPYPPGLPYFTRSTHPPTLVLPETLSPAFRPRTEATLPLTVWHELAHAFLLQREVVRTPAWLREFVPQAAAAAVARRVGLPLEDHLSRAEDAGFTIRGFEELASAGDQMSFQNLLLRLGAAALEEFGEGFLKRLFRALWEEDRIVDEERAEELLAGALGSGGRRWLESRPEFQGENMRNTISKNGQGAEIS